MIRTSELVLSFLVNASWQIAVIAIAALVVARLLSKAPTRYRHILWLVALVLCLALPLWSVFSFAGTNGSSLEYANGLLQTEIASTSPPNPRATERAHFAQPTPTTAPTNMAHLTFDWLLQRRTQSMSASPGFLVTLAFGYAAFLLYFIGRLGHSWRQTQKLRRSVYERKISPRMRALETHCTTAMRVESVPLVCSDEARVPLTVGDLRPLIILPPSFYQEQSEETLCSVLGHELAHIARRDFAINLACKIILLPIAFHPLARFIKRQIDRTRELACDELVTERLLEPETHARSLVEVADRLVIPANQPAQSGKPAWADGAFMLGIFDADILEERIMKLTQHRRRLGVRAGRLLTVTAISLLCFSALAISTFSFELQTRPESTKTIAPASSEGVRQTSDEVSADEIQRSVQEQTRLTSTLVQTERALRSADPQERAQAACDAGKRRALTSISELISMLSDDSKITPLACWADGRWSPAIDTFKGPSPGEQAAIALASMGSPAFKPLTEALDSANTSVRRNAAWAIGELTNMRHEERADAVEPLISLLGDADSWTRMAAARALGELRDERSSEGLVAALLDVDGGVRQTSAWALGEMKDKNAVQTLCTLLVSDVLPEVRLAAAEALGEIRSHKAVASLNQALSDSEPRVRARAKWAIEEIEDTDG